MHVTALMRSDSSRVHMNTAVQALLYNMSASSLVNHRVQRCLLAYDAILEFA
jgi:hypothetical protein